MSLLNSEFTQTVLKFGLSKSGIAVRWLVGLAIGALAKQHIFPDGNLDEIRMGLESGGMALAAILYGLVEWWLQHRQKDGVRAIQEAINVSAVPVQLERDGIAGNSTVAAVAKAAGVPAAVAVSAVKGKND